MLPARVILLLICLLPVGAAGEKFFIPVTDMHLPTDLGLLDVNDQVVNLKPDRPLLINLWALWCAPCLEELPSLSRLRQQFADTELAMVALNSGDSLKDAREFVALHPIDFPVLLDISTRYSQRLKPIGLPTTYLVDTRGVVRFRFEGKADWTSPSMLSKLRRALAELTTPP